MNTVASPDGTTIAYDQSGEGPPVILVGAAFNDRQTTAPLAAALAPHFTTIGVMPRHLVDQEIAHAGLTRLDVVAGMHQRKARMAELADAFIALPGGAGTLEELFEAWTWGQLGLHAKPAALLDIDGFYRPLTEQLRVMSAAGYLSDAHLRALARRVSCPGCWSSPSVT